MAPSLLAEEDTEHLANFWPSSARNGWRIACGRTGGITPTHRLTTQRFLPVTLDESAQSLATEPRKAQMNDDPSGPSHSTPTAQAVPALPAHETTLRYWFRCSGLSKTALAKAITTLAIQRGHHQVRPDASRVRRWIEDGERPRNPVPVLLAQVLSERVGYPLTAEDLGLGDPTPDDTRYCGPHEVLDGIQTVTSASLAHGHHNTAIKAKNSAPDLDTETDAARLLSALESWAYTPSRPLPALLGSYSSLGTQDVARLATFTATFRKLDNRYGGASMLYSATAHLADTVRLLRGGTYHETVGRQLYAELADLAGVVGWASHDAGNYPAAVRYLTLAVHAAREGHDRSLTAHLLQCLARIWGYLGKPAPARDYVALALYGARNVASPVLRAGLHALDARFAALLGNERESLRAVHNALETFADGSNQDTPAYAAYLDYPELASTLGEVLLFLARKTGNQAHASTALGLLSEASQGRAELSVRSRVFDAIGLARAQLTVGELDAAYHNGLHALQIGTSLTSTRVRKRYHDLARETQTHADIHLANLRKRLLIAATPGPREL